MKEVNVGQPAAMKEVADVINTVSLDEQKLYLQWNLINSAASYLSDDFVAQDFDFYGKTMSGKKEMQPRWKRAVSTVDGALGEVVGQMYVEKYFPAAAKERIMVAPALRAELAAQKKGDKIAQELAAKNLTSVEAYAETMGSSVDSVKFVNFGTRRIAGIGIEPNLNAMVSMAQVDQVSAPVKGNNGVYVFKVYARNKDGKEFNEAEEIRALDASNAYRVGFQAIQSMVNNAKVEDNRIRFY